MPTQNSTSTPEDVKEPREEGLDETTCSRCLESRKLADDAMATLREIKNKYGLGDRHVMREKNRKIENLERELNDSRIEAQKWRDNIYNCKWPKLYFSWENAERIHGDQ